VIHKESGKINLHILHTGKGERVWVPFPLVDPIAERLKISTQIESFSYEELVKQASNYPLFKRD